MSDIPRPQPLAPLVPAQGRSRIEGTLLTDSSTVKRKPKSAFLRNLERKQKQKVKHEVAKGDDRRKVASAPMGAPALSVVSGRRSQLRK